MLRVAVSVAVIVGSAAGQSSSAKYQASFENDVVVIHHVDLPAHGSAPTLESAHDSFWIAITEGRAIFALQQGKSAVQFQPGDIRFFSSFETKQVTNSGETALQLIVVALKPRGLIANGCECTGSTGKSICGCKGGSHLESLWALSLGDVTLAGTSLAAAQSFQSAAVRDDMLLVAITDLQLHDEAASEEETSSVKSAGVRLKPGDALWIKGGPHQFKNAGTEPARFITFEF